MTSNFRSFDNGVQCEDVLMLDELSLPPLNELIDRLCMVGSHFHFVLVEWDANLENCCVCEFPILQ